MKDKEYIPINCSFHDQLLELATFKSRVKIVFNGRDHETNEIVDVIEDVFTSPSKAEFLRTRGGEEIRLDQIISAGKYIAPLDNIC